MKTPPHVTLQLLNSSFKVGSYGLMSHVLESFILAMILLILAILKVHPMVVIILFLISIFIVKKLRSTWPDWVKRGKSYGELILNENSINTEIRNSKKTFDISAIRHIELWSNYYQGFSRPKDIVYNGLTVIKIKDLKDSIVTLNFLIKSEEEFKLIIAVLQSWYRKNINISELVTEHRLKGFLLQCNLSYSENQKLKAETYRQ
jgi:hypothetical protein